MATSTRRRKPAPRASKGLSVNWTPEARLAFAAGILCGDGHIAIKRDANGKAEDIGMGIGMRDGATIRLFAEALKEFVPPRRGAWMNSGIEGLIVRNKVVDGGKEWWWTGLSANPAVVVLCLLYPYMQGTYRGEQAFRAFEAMGLNIEDPNPTMPVRVRVHSEETRKKISESLRVRHASKARGRVLTKG